jgi:RNA recognition motif-containing protein
MNLYVGNISPAVQPAELQQMFAGVGQVLYASLSAGVDDRIHGKGYAFVYVPNDEHARQALTTLNGKLVKGEKLTVSRMSERPGVVGGSRK